MKKINRRDIKSLEFGHIKCDGTCNMFFEMGDGSFIDIFGLTLKQCESIERWYDKTTGSLAIDDRLLTLSEELWLSQNGIVR